MSQYNSVKIPAVTQRELHRLFGAPLPKKNVLYTSDYITYKCRNKGQARYTHLDNVVCYSKVTYIHNQPMSEWEVITHVPAKTGFTQFQGAFSFLQDLTDFCLIPANTEFEVDEKGNGSVKIPPHQGHPLLTYIGLCASRWLATLPELVRAYLGLRRVAPHLTPYQLIPFLSSHLVNNSNHTPIHADYLGGMKTRNPYHYLSLAIFAWFPKSYTANDYLVNQTAHKANSLIKRKPMRLMEDYHIFHPDFSSFFANKPAGTEAEVIDQFYALLGQELSEMVLQSKTERESNA